MTLKEILKEILKSYNSESLHFEMKGFQSSYICNVMQYYCRSHALDYLKFVKEFRLLHDLIPGDCQGDSWDMDLTDYSSSWWKNNFRKSMISRCKTLKHCIKML